MAAAKFKVSVLSLTGVFLWGVFANAAETSLVPAPNIVNGNDSLRSDTESGHLRVKTHEVESGQTFSLPADNPTFYLVKNPNIAVVTESRPSGLIIQGKRMGETLVLVWETQGVRSYRIRVLRPSEQEEQIRESIKQGSKLIQSQRARSFKIFYDTTQSSFFEGPILPHVSESRKVFGHRIQVKGNSPYGDLIGSYLYEYRKEDQMQKSVALPRDFWGGITNSNLPYIKNYDILGGTQYLSLGQFGMPGGRYNGLTFIPSLIRQLYPRRGQNDVNFFIGQRRDGSYIDNPAGTQNRELDGKQMGMRVDRYLWKDGRVSIGGYKQWSGERTVFDSKSNLDSQFDFKFPFMRLRGEGGRDDQGALAGHFIPWLGTDWAWVEARGFYVDKNYRTITGGVLDRGNLGIQTRWALYPLMPFGAGDRIGFLTGIHFTKNKLSTNPDRPDAFYKTITERMTIKLGKNIRSDTYFLYDNRRAAVFPYVEREITERVTKDFIFNTRWVNRLRVFATATTETFTKAEDSEGFNSKRMQVGGGATLNFKSGFWVSGQVLWNKLKEMEPSSPPKPTTHPTQFTVAGGWVHAFEKIPVTASVDVRYVDEEETFNKVHQPFLNEDRLEISTGLNWKWRKTADFFVRGSTAIIESITEDEERAELNLIFGMRMLVDTGFYIPQKGVIDGYFFEDKNGNGKRDPGEPGIMGQEISLADGTKTQTNDDGYYKFKVREGNVKLKVTSEVPEGYFFTTMNTADVEVMPQSHNGFDFAIAPQIQAKGVVFVDVNRNGLFEKTDLPMSGIQIALDSGQLAVSNSDGIYSILRIPPGKNKIRTVFDSIPAGYQTVTAVEKTFEGSPGDIVNFNVVLSARRVASGYVFEDVDGDNKFDPGEPVFHDVQINMGDKTAKTGKNGKYIFSDILPGHYELTLVKETLPAGYRPSFLSHEIGVGTGLFAKYDLHFPLKKASE